MNVRNLSPEDSLKLLEESKIKSDRHVLYSSNRYIQKGFIFDKQFDEDIEAQNFYLMDKKVSDGKLGHIQIYPNSKTGAYNLSKAEK